MERQEFREALGGSIRKFLRGVYWEAVLVAVLLIADWIWRLFYSLCEISLGCCLTVDCDA